MSIAKNYAFLSDIELLQTPDEISQRAAGPDLVGDRLQIHTSRATNAQ